MNKQKIQQIFELFRANNPKPKGELEHINNYTLLVAVVLSAQATDKSVNKATHSLFTKIKTPKDMVNLGEEKLIEYIKSIGLYRGKAKNIISLSEVLIQKHNSQVPNSQKALEALSGVGRKTANVVRNMAFGEPTIAVDTHVFRLSNRLGITDEKTPNKVGDKLEKIIPDEFKLYAHHWLILHGRYVCTARNPTCAGCTLYHLCEFNQKTV